MNQHISPEPVPLFDIGTQRRRLGKSIDDALGRVLAHCQFVNGPEVTALEQALAEFCDAKHVVTCASGTDALLMVLMAEGIGRGDAVLCPSFTFCATAEAVALTGATPVLVDVDEATFNLSAASLQTGIATARKRGLKPKAVIPVDLFGQCADHDAISAVAEAEGLFVLDDAAQGFGASYKGRRLGTSATPRPPASSRPSRSAATAMAARSSPTMAISPSGCAASACTARAATNTTMSVSD